MRRALRLLRFFFIANSFVCAPVYCEFLNRQTFFFRSLSIACQLDICADVVVVVVGGVRYFFFYAFNVYVEYRMWIFPRFCFPLL